MHPLEIMIPHESRDKTRAGSSIWRCLLFLHSGEDCDLPEHAFNLAKANLVEADTFFPVFMRIDGRCSFEIYDISALEIRAQSLLEVHDVLYLHPEMVGDESPVHLDVLQKHGALFAVLRASIPLETT